MGTIGLNHKHWPIFLKITVVFSVMVTVIILVTGLMSYQIYRQSMERQIGEFVPQVLLQANRQVESYVNDLTTVLQAALVPPYDKVTFEAFREINRSQTTPTLETTLKLHEMVELIKFRLKDRMLGVTFYTLKGDAYVYEYTGGTWMNDRPYESRPWFGRLDLDGFSPLVLGTVMQPSGNIGHAGNNFFFSVIQPVRLPGSKELIGVIQLFGMLEALKTIMNGIDLGPGSSLYILDHEDNIVYAPTLDQLGKRWNSAYGIDASREFAGSRSDIFRQDGNAYLVSLHRSPETGWTIIGITPQENFSKGISTVRIWTVVWIVLGVLAAALLSIMVSYTFTGRLRKLSRQIRTVQLDELHLKLGNVQYDEIGYLSDSFRTMINRIRNLVEEVWKTKLLKQEAEIKALYSQINPHFLYNVLETIRMTVKNGDADEAEAALVSLGHVFRYQVLQKNDLVAIRTELEFIGQYLYIQQLRFGDQLEVELDIAPETNEALIPRMIIQPIVENALKYGRSPSDYSIRLTLRVNLNEGRLMVKIIDEGAGMTPDRLNKVLIDMEKDFSSGHRIGLANVYQRIKHIYGEDGSMSIQSEEEVGTIVSISLSAAKSHAADPSQEGAAMDESTRRR